MGLGILSVKYQTETRGAVDLDVLQACIGEKIKVITELYFDQIVVPNQDDDIYFNPPPQYTKQYYNDNLIFFNKDFSFLAKAEVGDIFICDSIVGNPNPGATFTLLEKITESIGKFDMDFNAYIAGLQPGNFIANITQLKSLLYQVGINESGNYVSLTDDSLQKFIINSATPLTDVASQALEATGNKDWQIDTVTLVGLGDDTDFPPEARVQIKLTHEVVVSPLFLAGQYDNLRLGLAPDYFKSDNVIKYQAQIDWNKISGKLDDSKSVTIGPVGQFGWFGTKYDGTASGYGIGSLTIQRVSDSEFVNQLEYNEMEIKFTVESDTGSFDVSDTAFVFGFNFLPDDVAFYQNTNRLLSKNFCFDSKKFNPDNITVNGNNFGLGTQVIKTIKGEVISAGVVEITARILFGADQVAILTQGDEAAYSMWIIAEDTSLDVEVCDKASLLVQVDIIHVQLTKVDLLNDVTKFIEHMYEVVGDGEDTLEMFPVDDVAVNSTFALDYTGIENDGILLKSCTPKLVLTHATEADIVLDSFKINLDSYTTIGSAPAVQAIDFNQLRPYKIENGIRKYISFQRDFNADTSSIKHFVLNFPFMNRWEYWLKIAKVTNIPSSLFDPSVPFNGGNHLWNRLANSAGWSLVYRTTFEILQNGELFEQEFEHELTSTYFDSNTDWNNCSIKTYDIDTNDEIIVGPKKYVNAKKDTKIICSFDKTVGLVPPLDQVAIVMWAEGFDGGGVSEITRISSVYDVTDVSLLKSSDASNKVIITKVGSVFKGEALLRFDKIQNLAKLNLYARIYETDGAIITGRITNDFILRYTNDGQIRLVLS